MKSFKKKKWIFSITLLIILIYSIIILFYNTKSAPTIRVGEVLKLYNGDSKFYNNEIYTSTGCLTRYSFNGEKIKEYPNIISNWIDIDHNVLIYGNFNNEIGIVEFDNDKNITWNKTIFNDQTLKIDPTIRKINDIWYITFTTIEGNVNNSDSNNPNGVYTVNLYKSYDLNTWEKESTIIHANNNIEDPDLMYENDFFYFSYEKEILDKGKSSICIKKSKNGIDWSNEQEILPATADQEPAKYYKTSKGYTLYYSSDKDNLGKSYMGAKLYYALLDKNFNLIKKDQEIKTTIDQGILLYDVCTINGNQYFLISQNYLTDCNMIIEMRKERKK